MIQNVTLGEYHCLNDLGMLLASKTIGTPATQTTYIQVPGRDGSIDMSEALSGTVAYTDRTIELTFATCENVSKEGWADFLSNVMNAVHGKRLHIVFDDDPDWYYDGRCEVNSFLTSGGKQKVVIDCTCDPYKYRVDDPSVKSL